MHLISLWDLGNSIRLVIANDCVILCSRTLSLALLLQCKLKDIRYIDNSAKSTKSFPFNASHGKMSLLFLNADQQLKVKKYRTQVK